MLAPQCRRKQLFTQHIINLEGPWSQGGEDARQKNSSNREGTIFGLRSVMGNLYSPDPCPVLPLDACFGLYLERGCWNNLVD